MNQKSNWIDIKFMFILSFVCALFLGGTRTLIGDKAELSDRTIEAIFNILGEKKENDLALFNSSFKELSTGRIKIWSYLQNKNIVVCEATGSGMWSEITIVFVFDRINKKILGLKVTEQNETAGLGNKIIEDDFCNQFCNLEIGNSIRVDAISGATTSSKSVEQLLIKSVNKIDKCDIIR